MRFYLGTPEPSWLGSVRVPLFVSHRRLARLGRLPVAVTRWALDSGGFSELSMFGAWQTSPAMYAAAIDRYRAEIGRLDWAAPQDWMCEPWIVAKTGHSVGFHQRATVDSMVELRAQVGELVVPVLQGWQLGDYLACAELYRDAGIDLTAEPVVGLGSVCRRQGTGTIAAIVAELAGYGFALHGFGIKTQGLGLYAGHLASADSMAWSYNARRRPPLPGCTHRSCANCPRWALRWRERVLRRARTQQLTLLDAPYRSAA
jgi:hypothetical protein